MRFWVNYLYLKVPISENSRYRRDLKKFSSPKWRLNCNWYFFKINLIGLNKAQIQTAYIPFTVSIFMLNRSKWISKFFRNLNQKKRLKKYKIQTHFFLVNKTLDLSSHLKTHLIFSRVVNKWVNSLRHDKWDLDVDDIS